MAAQMTDQTAGRMTEQTDPPSEPAAPATEATDSLVTTMRVRKRNGDLEPVDVNKIVRAVAALRRRPRPASTRCGSPPAPSRAWTTARPPASSTSCRSAPRRRSSCRSPTTPSSPPASCTVHRQGGPEPGHPLASASRSSPAIASASSPTRRRRVRRRNARKLNDAIERDQSNLFEFFGLRTVYDRYLLRHPSSAGSSRPRSTSSSASRAACPRAPTRPSRFYHLISSLEYLPSCPTLFNSGTATRRCRAATCSTPPRTTSTPSTTATPTSPGSPSTPAASASPTTGSARGAR